MLETLAAGAYVVADDESYAGLTELLEVGLLHGFDGLEFEVGDEEAGFSGLGEDFDLGCDGAGEFGQERGVHRRRALDQ